MQRRAKVEVSEHAARRGRPRLWAYGYADLALLFGMKEPAVRRAVADGRLDPSSLQSVLAFAAKRRTGRAASSTTTSSPGT